MTYDYDESKFGVFSLQFSTEREMFVVGYGDGSIEVRISQRDISIILTLYFYCRVPGIFKNLK